MTGLGRWPTVPCMGTSREAVGRPERGLFGIVPPGRATDVAVAALTGVVQIGLTIGASRNNPARQPLDLLAFLLLAVGPVALLWRWRSPAGVLAVVTASNVLYFALGYPYGPAWLALIVAFWTAVTGGARRAAWITAFAGLAASFALAAPVGGGAPGPRARGRPPAELAPAGPGRGRGGHGRPPAASGGRADPGRGGQAAGRRGAHAHRPRAPRRARPQHTPDQRPGRRGPAPDGRAAGPVPQRPPGHQAGLQRRPGRAAVGAGRAPPGRRGPAPDPALGPGPPGPPGRRGGRHRAGGAPPGRV